MKNKIRYIKCEGLRVAASVEAHDNNCAHKVYYPSNILFYIKQGQLNLKVDQKLHIIPKESFVLIRKFTFGEYYKSWQEEEKHAIMYALILQDDFIRSAINSLELTTTATPTKDKIIPLPSNKILRGLFDSFSSYLTDDEDIDTKLLTLKSKEALLGVFKANPSCISIFSQFSNSERANLEDFVHHNYNLNIPLNEFAQMSGRSLSTFNREFKIIFNDSPHRWIKKRRLEMAKELLLTTSKKPSEFYFNLGFADLAHFSKSFKKEFGQTPTQIRKSIF